MSAIRDYLPDRQVLRQWVGGGSWFHGNFPPRGLCLPSHLECKFVGLEEKSRQGKFTREKILGHGKEMTPYKSDFQTNPCYWHVEQVAHIIFLTSWGRVRMLFTQDCGYNRNVGLLRDTYCVSHSPWLLHWRTQLYLLVGLWAAD